MKITKRLTEASDKMIKEFDVTAEVNEDLPMATDTTELKARLKNFIENEMTDDQRENATTDTLSILDLLAEKDANANAAFDILDFEQQDAILSYCDEILKGTGFTPEYMEEELPAKETLDLHEAEEEPKAEEGKASETTMEVGETTAAEVGKALDAAAGGDSGLTKEEEKDAAETINVVGQKIGAKQAEVVPTDAAPIVIKNRLTEALDDALEAALFFRREHIDEVPNVIVSGLPGSSKTASVYNWAKNKVNVTYVDAKNNDLNAFINGYTVRDPNDPTTVTQAISKNLNGLDNPRSVLFLDELNRQTRSQIRGSLLTLINDHYIQGKEVGGKHYFKNFLFTIAAINPHTAHDEGAADLNDAEKTRYMYYVKNFDSDPDTTSQYMTQKFLGLANRLAKMTDTKTQDVWSDPAKQYDLVKDMPDQAPAKSDRILTYLRITDLSNFILQDPDFKYDDKNALDDTFYDETKLFNQRTFTSSITACKGNPTIYVRYLKNASNFRQAVIGMLTRIIAKYKAKSDAELLATYGFKPEDVYNEEPEKLKAINNYAAAKAKAEEEAKAKAAAAAAPKEDSKGTFVGGSGNGKASVSASDAKSKILNAASSWGF